MPGEAVSDSPVRIRRGRVVCLALQTIPHVLHVLVELAQGVAVGGYGEPVGVRDPYARSACGVLGQGVYASRRLTVQPPECGSVSRTTSCLEQIHGASCLLPRPVGTILRSPGFSVALVGACQRFSRYLSWRVVADRRIFALAFGAVSTYTFALVEGENIRERL
jgi:hypothetical protein